MRKRDTWLWVIYVQILLDMLTGRMFHVWFLQKI